MDLTMNPTTAQSQTAEPVIRTSSEAQTQTNDTLSPEQLQLLLLNMAQNLDKRLSMIEDRLLISPYSYAQQQKATRFPQFPNLPVEIRLNIWELTIPQRKLRPLSGKTTKPMHRNPNHYAPPTIARVCHESRSVAHKRGAMYLLRGREPHRPVHPYSYWTWFDGKHDILDLHAGCLPGTEEMPTGLMAILEQAETVILPLEHLEQDWVDFMMRNSKVRQNLRTIYLQRTLSEQAHKLRWSPQALSTLFLTTKFLLLNLNDAEQVEGYLDLIASNPPEQRDRFNHWLDCWAGENALLEAPEFSPGWAKEIITAAWGVQANQSNLLKYFPQIGGSEDDDRAVEKLWAGKMPELRPVYVVEETKVVCDCSIGSVGGDGYYQPGWDLDAEVYIDDGEWDDDESDSDE